MTPYMTAKLTFMFGAPSLDRDFGLAVIALMSMALLDWWLLASWQARRKARKK